MNFKENATNLCFELKRLMWWLCSLKNGEYFNKLTVADLCTASVISFLVTLCMFRIHHTARFCFVSYLFSNTFSTTQTTNRFKGMRLRETIWNTHRRGSQKVKVKVSRNRPGVAQRVPGGLGSQIFMTFGTWRWWGCQPHASSAFTPRKCSWYSFSLGAESTPGPWWGRREYVTEKFSDTTGNRSRDRPTSSAAP